MQPMTSNNFGPSRCIARQLLSCYNDNERGMQKIDMSAILHLQEFGSKVTWLSSRGKKLLTINARKRRPQRAVTSSKGIVKKSNPASSAVVAVLCLCLERMGNRANSDFAAAEREEI